VPALLQRCAEGAGAASAAPAAAAALLRRSLRLASPANADFDFAIADWSPKVASFFGGFYVTVNGRGFVPRPPTPGVNLTAVLGNETKAAWAGGQPPPFQVVQANTTSMLLYVEPYVPRDGDDLNASDTNAGYSYNVVPPGTNRDQFWRYPRGNFWWRFSKAHAPYVSNVDASGCSLGSDCTLTVAWGIAQGRSQGVQNISAGGQSAAVVLLTSGSSMVECTAAGVQSSSISSGSYNETVTCSVNGTTAAASYNLWVGRLGWRCCGRGR
jgi:hypothetical protein